MTPRFFCVLHSRRSDALCTLLLCSVPCSRPLYPAVSLSDEQLSSSLAARTLELVNIPSVSRSEQPLLEHVAGLLAAWPTFDVRVLPGEGVLALPRTRSSRPLVLLAGHLDTVPEQGNLPGRREGDVLHGLGSSDMKGSLAVMLALAGWIEAEQPELLVDLGLLFFPREELPPADSAVPGLFEAWPEMRQTALAIVMEPTDGTLQLGCLGNLNARLIFSGKSAHSARPWQGENALHKAIKALQPLAEVPLKPVNIGGLTYTEVLSLTQISGGVAQNVIPESVVCHVNFRYAPDRTAQEAEAFLTALTPVAGQA